MNNLETFKRLRERFRILIDKYPEDDYFKKEYDKFTRIINTYKEEVKVSNLEKDSYYCKKCSIEFCRANSQVCPRCGSRKTLRILIHK